jgi:hypothetical protein
MKHIFTICAFSFLLLQACGQNSNNTASAQKERVLPQLPAVSHAYELSDYLSENEMQQLQRLVSAYLDIAEDMAIRQIPMTMEDWENRLNKFIAATDREILQNAGKVTAEIAKAHAESEFEKYRIIQDQNYVSDFDKEMLKLIDKNSSDE